MTGTRSSSYAESCRPEVSQFHVTEGEALLLQAGMGYEKFVAGMTAVWQYSADLFWRMHEVVREANPHWNPPTEGNETSA